MNNRIYLKQLLDYYEYLITLTQSRTSMPFGDIISILLEGKDIPSDQELSDIEYDLETERNRLEVKLFLVQQGKSILTFKQ